MVCVTEDVVQAGRETTVILVGYLTEKALPLLITVTKLHIHKIEILNDVFMYCIINDSKFIDV